MKNRFNMSHDNRKSTTQTQCKYQDVYHSDFGLKLKDKIPHRWPDFQKTAFGVHDKQDIKFVNGRSSVGQFYRPWNHTRFHYNLEKDRPKMWVWRRTCLIVTRYETTIYWIALIGYDVRYWKSINLFWCSWPTLNMRKFLTTHGIFAWLIALFKIEMKCHNCMTILKRRHHLSAELWRMFSKFGN